MKKLLPFLLGAAALIVSFSPSSASAGVRVGVVGVDGAGADGAGAPGIYVGPRYGYYGGYYPYRRYYYGGYYPRYYGYYPYRRYAYRNKWRRRW